MAKTITVVALSRVIADLQRQRDQHGAAIAQIDQAFARFGVKPGALRRPARPKGSGRVKESNGRRKRRKFSKTADQFVLGLLKGGRKLSTRDINVRWKRGRRGGSADNTLMKLVKDKQIQREAIKDAHGSNYSLVTKKSSK